MDLIEEANCISNEKDRIDLIFFDSKEDKSIVTNKREDVCMQTAIRQCTPSKLSFILDDPVHSRVLHCQ